jgi:hypothetical protein
LPKKCSEKTNTGSKLSWYICTLGERNRAHAVNVVIAAIGEENCRGEMHNELARELLGVDLPHQTSPSQLHCSKSRNISMHSNRRHKCTVPSPLSATSAATGISGNRSVCTGSHFPSDSDTSNATIAVPQIITELSAPD